MLISASLSPCFLRKNSSISHVILGLAVSGNKAPKALVPGYDLVVRASLFGSINFRFSGIFYAQPSPSASDPHTTTKYNIENKSVGIWEPSHCSNSCMQATCMGVLVWSNFFRLTQQRPFDLGWLQDQLRDESRALCYYPKMMRAVGAPIGVLPCIFLTCLLSISFICWRVHRHFQPSMSSLQNAGVTDAAHSQIYGAVYSGQSVHNDHNIVHNDNSNGSKSQNRYIVMSPFVNSTPGPPHLYTDCSIHNDHNIVHNDRSQNSGSHDTYSMGNSAPQSSLK